MHDMVTTKKTDLSADVRKLKAVKKAATKGTAVLRYAMDSKDRTLVTEAVNKKFDAERAGGQVLAGAVRHQGGRPRKNGSTSGTVSLAEIGITKKDSMRWQELARLPPKEFNRRKAAAIDSAVSAWEKVRAATQRDDYERRADKGQAVASLQALVDAGRHFGVILADPPWTFEVYSGKGKERSAERHYDTMSLDAIKALPVQQLATRDCVLLLWAPLPQLPEALAVIEAWGFKYKTCGFCWVKQTPNRKGLHWGMGYWTRANVEVCLLATRGEPKRVAKDVHQVVMAPVGKHSEKPGEVAERVERLVDGPYLEMFGRRLRDRWTVWGDEV